jgi:hypothetical protein
MGRDGLKARDREPPVEDEDALAGPDLIDERAEPVLGLRDRGSLHMGYLAISTWLVKL